MPAVYSASGRPETLGPTAMIDWRTAACGKRMPSWRTKDDAHAPPAITTVRVRMVPFSVTTPQTRPPWSSRPRAAQNWCTVPPYFITPKPATGTAREVSAMPSVGENTPPFQARPVALPCSRASAAPSTWVTTPSPAAKSRHFAQRSISASSLLR